MSKLHGTGKLTVYLLYNLINFKTYFGQTWMRLEDRMGKNGINYNNSPYLYNAIQKYGPENFVYFKMQICGDQETGDNFEKNYIKQYNTQNPNIGYNIKEGGSAGKHSPETIEKMRQSAIETSYWRGKNLPQETKDKISATKLEMEYHHTDEWKIENGERTKKRQAENGHPMQGQHHTEEAKQKIGAASKGKKLNLTDEQKTIRGLKHRMPHEKEQKIIELYNQNIPIKVICKTLNVGINGIYRVLDRNNIPRNSKSKPQIITSEIEDQIIKMYLDNIICDKIKQALGISSNGVIYSVLKRRNIPIRSKT